MSFDGEVFFESVRNKNTLINKATGSTLKALGLQGSTIAKRKANFNKGYQTGETKNSIRSVVEKDAAFVGANTEHAVYLEFGTRKMEPQPFMRPALLEQSGKSIKVIQKMMDDEVKTWTLSREKL